MAPTRMPTQSAAHVHIWGRRAVRYGVPVALLLGFLWFPFDWLSETWPAFGIPFRQVFRNAHDHFIGHTAFFLVIGLAILAEVPALRRKPLWYFAGLVGAALVQEAIQALFRGVMPRWSDGNALKGDALGGTIAYLLWWRSSQLPSLRLRRQAR